MKFFRVLIFIVFNFLDLDYCNQFDYSYYEDVAVNSHVLSDIVNEFIFKENIKFDILFFNHISQLQKDILTDFMSKINGNLSYQVKSYNLVARHVRLLHGSNIFAIKSLDDFAYIESFLKIIRYQNQPIKYFILVPNLTFKELQMSNIYKTYQSLTVHSNSAFHYSYFITNEMDTVTLSTVEWFSPHGCNIPYLSIINNYNKKSRTWSSKLKNYEKFLNYHGCELVMMLPTMKNDRTIENVCGFSVVNDDKTDFDIIGITPAIFGISSKFYNYNPTFQPVRIDYHWFESIKPRRGKIIEINGTSIVPDVYFQIQSLHISNSLTTRTSHVIENLNARMFVTPAEKYTAYEKFFLPFDLETWIFLTITFFSTFLLIFIVNRLSKSARSLVYGHKVETPIWNVIRIFFGISQTKLPSQNFPRFILIMFISFCLIFRTCFQSKFFEFMTSEPRRDPPRTIEDVIERNYSVVSTKGFHAFSSRIDQLWQWQNITQISLFDFKKAFLTQSQNVTAKLALCVDEFNLNFIESEIKRNNDWNQLDDSVLYTHQEVFMFWSHSYYFRMYKMLIDSLIPTGIMKYLVDTYYTKKLQFEKFDEGPKVLSVDDLLFGFKIWLGCCLISVLSFVAEILYQIILKPRKIEFYKVHPIELQLMQTELNAELRGKFKVKSANSLIPFSGAVFESD
ncbi:unnamed protein product [Chironomus riparius]|uniref:Ionotropic receptor n=1 Tax=Chironomus riparius TaxID=315576 RepID=A0A9N9WK26_9DIPT|nr:unnamed protein product [Chironomus riparius]